MKPLHQARMMEAKWERLEHLAVGEEAQEKAALVFGKWRSIRMELEFKEQLKAEIQKYEEAKAKEDWSMCTIQSDKISELRRRILNEKENR